MCDISIFVLRVEERARGDKPQWVLKVLVTQVIKREREREQERERQQERERERE